MVHIVDMDQSNAIRFLHFCVPLRVAAFAPQSSFLRLLAYLQPSTGTAAHAISSSSSVAGARRRTCVHEVAAPTATYLLLAALLYSLLITHYSPLAAYPQPRGEDLRVERRVRRRHDAPVHHEQQLAQRFRSAAGAAHAAVAAGLAALGEKQEEVKATLRRLAAFVGEDPNKADPDAIFRAARQLLEDAAAQGPS